MVQKRGKHGIRTGNTIRAVEARLLRRYRKEVCIIRRDTTVGSKDHTDVPDGVFEGADIPCEDVVFSLNKKKRWLLPELIKDEIKRNWQPTDEEDPFDINRFELVERHKIVRNNNCFSIHAFNTDSTKDNIVRTPTIKLMQHGYIDADNVLKTPAIFSRHTNRLKILRDFDELGDFIDECETKTIERPCDSSGTDISEENNDNVQQTPPVRYEVLYPCEHSNVLTLKSKRIGIDTKKIFKCRNYIRRPWIQHGYKLRSKFVNDKHNVRNAILEGLEDFRLEQYDNIYNSLSDDFQEVEDYKNRKVTFKVPAESIRQYETKTSDPTGKSVHSVSSEVEKEETMVIENKIVKKHQPETDEKKAEGDSLYFFPRKITRISVCVLLQKAEIDRNALEKHHGDDYLECRCSPRKFIINISKYINDLDLEGIGSAYKLLRVISKSMFAWLVFAHDSMHKLNSHTEEVYNVSLNANFNERVTDVAIEGLVEGSVVTITDIIGHTLDYLKSLPRESMIFQRKSNACGTVKVVSTTSLLEEMKNWSACSYLPDDHYVIKHLIQSTSPEAGFQNPQILQDQTNECPVCYTKTSINLALLSCAHFFCNKCWDATINTKVAECSDVILCPEYNCGNTVDIGTIISFLSVEDILKFARRCHNIYVDRNMLARWCSNESCGRVVIVNSRDARVARCSCGESMCCMCLGRPHWPLSCKRYLEYVHTVIETRDKNIIPHDFVIKFDNKYCRICFKIIVRYDKCATERCQCGGVLCIRCSYLWHTRDMLTSKPIDNQISATFNPHKMTALVSNTQNRNNVLSESIRTKWYKLAFKHRLLQHPFRVAKIHANSKLLANRITHYILREEKKGHSVYLSFMFTNHSYLRESEKVIHYMEQFVNVYQEICGIIENVAFFLNDDGRSNGINEWLHQRVMILSTCAKTILDLIKDGAFLNPKVVIERLNDTGTEIKRVLDSIAGEL